MLIIEKEFNVITGEEIIIEKEESEADKKERQLREAKDLARHNVLLEATAAKAALLEKLGITEEEAKLLLS